MHQSTPPTWRGFSFTLHLLKVQGFYFVRRQYSCIQAFTARFAPSMQFIPPQMQKRLQGFTGAFFCDCTRLTAHDTSPIQPAIIPPATRWSVSQRRSISSTYQTQPLCRTLYRATQPPYYNKVYKGAGVRSCYRSTPDGATHYRPYKPGGVSSYRLWISGKHCTGRGVSILSTPGSLQSGTRSAVRAHRLEPSTRRGSPAAGARRAARNH